MGSKADHGPGRNQKLPRRPDDLIHNVPHGLAEHLQASMMGDVRRTNLNSILGTKNSSSTSRYILKGEESVGRLTQLLQTRLASCARSSLLQEGVSRRRPTAPLRAPAQRLHDVRVVERLAEGGVPEQERSESGSASRQTRARTIFTLGPAALRLARDRPPVRPAMERSVKTGRRLPRRASPPPRRRSPRA